jgi:hypothetical protein
VTPRLARLQAFFRGDRLVAVSTARCEAYAAQRQGQGASNATINRELAVLGRMLRLAFEHASLARVPKIRKLTESAPRAGFVKRLISRARTISSFGTSHAEAIFTPAANSADFQDTLFRRARVALRGTAVNRVATGTLVGTPE